MNINMGLELNARPYILHFLYHCAEADNKQNPEYILAVFCDLSKAFDVINHKILLHTLKMYGIRGLANDWFSSYLSNRTQFLEIYSQNYSHKQFMCGDIHKSCESSILSLADDTTLYMLEHNLVSLFETANI